MLHSNYTPKSKPWWKPDHETTRRANWEEYVERTSVRYQETPSGWWHCEATVNLEDEIVSPIRCMRWETDLHPEWNEGYVEGRHLKYEVDRTE